jgi:hypothetical protein
MLLGRSNWALPVRKEDFMVQIVWDAIGQRRFETGVDRGVLYPGPLSSYMPGVAWNGLTGVDEKSVGDAVQPYYYDGVRYLVLTSQTDFAATISAITYPVELEQYEGTYEMANGISVTQQPSQQFGLCYRTVLGNDVEGVDLGYKLHLIYGAITVPASRGYSTMTNTTPLTPFTWEIDTTPVETPGFKPMAHLVLDSTRIDPATLSIIENILYGDEDTDPRLPLPSEILGLTLGARFVIVIDDPNPALLPPSAAEGDVVYTLSDDGVYSVDGPSSPDVRPVFVINSGDPIPPTAIPGDIVYYEDTGELFKVGV